MLPPVLIFVVGPVLFVAFVVGAGCLLSSMSVPPVLVALLPFLILAALATLAAWLWDRKNPY